MNAAKERSTREKIRWYEVITILFAFVGVSVALNANDSASAYFLYALVWIALVMLCIFHQGNAGWRVVAAIIITAACVFLCFRYWKIHRSPAPDLTVSKSTGVPESAPQPVPQAAPLLYEYPSGVVQSVSFQNIGTPDPHSIPLISSRLDGIMDYSKRGSDSSYIVGIKATSYDLLEEQRIELRVAGKTITGFHAEPYASLRPTIETRDGDDYCITMDPFMGMDFHLEVISTQPEAIVVRYKLCKSSFDSGTASPPPVSFLPTPHPQ